MIKAVLIAVSVVLGVPIIAGLVFGVWFFASFHHVEVIGDGMAPTYFAHDSMLVNGFLSSRRKPLDGEIVAFTPPIRSSNPFVKRILASPGERFRVRYGITVADGVAIEETYLPRSTRYELEVRDYGIYVDGKAIDPRAGNIPPRARWTAPDTVPPGCYILLGDNRNESDDSHVWGFAQTSGTFYSGPRAGENAGSFEYAYGSR